MTPQRLHFSRAFRRHDFGTGGRIPHESCFLRHEALLDTCIWFAFVDERLFIPVTHPIIEIIWRSTDDDFGYRTLTVRIFDCLCIFGGKGFLFRYSYQWRPCDRLLHRRNSIPAFGSSSLPTIVAAAYGRASAAKHAPQAPRVGAHAVILTGLDEEGDSTDDEMPLPPLEPLEGAAQLGVVWLRGHGKGGCDPLVMPALVIGKGRER